MLGILLCHSLPAIHTSVADLTTRRHGLIRPYLHHCNHESCLFSPVVRPPTLFCFVLYPVTGSHSCFTALVEELTTFILGYNHLVDSKPCLLGAKIYAACSIAVCLIHKDEHVTCSHQHSWLSARPWFDVCAGRTAPSNTLQ